MIKLDDPRIEDGKLYGIVVDEYFSVLLNSSENPSINPKISFDGMPIKFAAKKVFDALKVQGRSGMRKYSSKELKEIFSGEVSWTALTGKEGAERQASIMTMDDTQLEKEIQKLTLLRKQKANNES